MELRYSELKYNGQVYTEQWQIDEILIKNKFNWIVNAEIKNARLEIFQDMIIWNGGIWYNGDWYFGVWRDGEWRYGVWQNGVWYNGVWRNGTFKLGIIYKGNFFKGEIIGGEIRGGNFIDVNIHKGVVEYNEAEYVQNIQQQQEEQEIEVIEPQVTSVDQVIVTGTKPQNQIEEEAPKIQEKNKYNMKTIKKYKELIEAVGDLEDSFVKIDIDKGELEVKDKESGQLAQVPGVEEIESASKTDAYNAQMRKGGEIIVDPKNTGKQMHYVKKFNDFK